MKDWNIIRPIAEQILSQQRYTNSGSYHGTRCFLTAYQLAVLIDKEDATLKGSLPIGGEGVGPDSFAREIARHLSGDFKNNVFDGRLEIQFLSLAGMNYFAFNGNNNPSADEFSMFRMMV